MERLNSDFELMKILKTYMEMRRATLKTILLVSDAWGESIRIRGDLWLKASELPSVYISSNYLEIVDTIAKHLKSVRKIFGGLTF